MICTSIVVLSSSCSVRNAQGPTVQPLPKGPSSSEVPALQKQAVMHPFRSQTNF